MSQEEQYRVAINAILKTLSETCRGFQMEVILDAVDAVHSALLVQESSEGAAGAAGAKADTSSLNELKDEIDRMHYAH